MTAFTIHWSSFGVGYALGAITLFVIALIGVAHSK